MSHEVTPSELTELFIQGFKPLTERMKKQLLKQIDVEKMQEHASFDTVKRQLGEEFWHRQHLSMMVKDSFKGETAMFYRRDMSGHRVFIVTKILKEAEDMWIYSYCCSGETFYSSIQIFSSVNDVLAMRKV